MDSLLQVVFQENEIDVLLEIVPEFTILVIHCKKLSKKQKNVLCFYTAV